MPQLNTSEAVRQRINQLITRLVEFANGELSDCEHLIDKVRARWIDPDSQSPKLVVETEIRFLAELVFQQQSTKTKDDLKQDLRTLEKFLGMLEDNRTRTQGSSIWHFTLQLWHTSVAQNLEKLNAEWARRKPEKSPSQAHGPSPIAVYPLSTAPLPPVQPAATENPAAHSSRPLYHNLPAKDYGQLIGRDSIRHHVWQQLASDHYPARIGIRGLGGIGKTSLVLDVAHQFLLPPTAPHPNDQGGRFAAIIFVSAQQHHLSPYGFLKRHRCEPTLLDMLRAIAQTMERPELLRGDAEAQLAQIQALLSRQPVLLIVDNLEAIAPDSQAAILSFLYDLPSTVTVLATSRDHLALDTLVVLEPLSLEAGLQLIAHQAHLKAVDLSAAEARRLFERTGGIPAAMVYAIGQLSGGYPLASVLPNLTLPTGDYCRYYLASAMLPLRDHPAHRLLMALALFPQSATREAIAQVALAGEATNPNDEIEGFAGLYQRSLVVGHRDRYALLPPTREYALAELNAHPEFEAAARARWVQWALAVSSQLETPHWREWSDSVLPHPDWENLQAVIEWCIEHDRYDDFRQLWALVKGYTYLHGYWNECLDWLTWWVEAAQTRQDQAGVAQALRDQGWMLMLMGQPSQLAAAAACFAQVWAQRDRQPPLLQVELAIEYATVLLQQGQLQPARDRLLNAREQLAKLAPSPHTASTCTKHAIRIDYYTAEIEYWQGNYDRAQALYQQVLTQARALQWVQVEVYTLNWLAEIALHHHRLDEAEALIEQGFPLAQRQGDKRSQAFHHKTKTRLEQLRGHVAQVRAQGAMAIAAFEALGMQAEADEIRAWVVEANR
jgi:tetratricopeptide (TPR) repeat protein